MDAETHPASTETSEPGEEAPEFRVVFGQVCPANDAAVAYRHRLNEREKLEGPPWSWLIAGPVHKPVFDAWRMEGRG